MTLLLTAYCSLLTSFAACGGDDQKRVGVDCLECHSRDALMARSGDDAAGPREWLVSSGEGLIANISPFTGVAGYALAWPRRGRHPEFTLDPTTCYTCHPVSETGANHSLDAYPAGAVESTGDCASQCHLWLATGVTSRGPGTGSYSGTMRPYELLTTTSTAHTRVFEDGYPSSEDRDDAVKVRFIGKGCVGCHSVGDPRHGTIATCTDCHSLHKSFSSASASLHAMHVSFAGGGGRGTGSACAFCHGFEGKSDLSNATCYNCHLSGHQPTTPLWP